MPDHPAPPDNDAHLTPSVYLTASLPALGGSIKARESDFLVEEIPLYRPAGTGEHIYLMVEKRGLGTIDLIGLIARHFGVGRGAVGYAGLKDKKAITRQVISVHAPRRRLEDFPSIDRDDVKVLWADYHQNKLRRGHLIGNRFSIRIRGVEVTGVLTARRALETLAREGVPNRVGEQRFGYLGNNHLIGRAMLLGDHRAAVEMLLAPHALAPAAQHEARSLYAAGRFAEALRAFPGNSRTECIALNALSKGRSPEDGVRAIDSTVRGYYVSAFQSAVFNRVLDHRLEGGTFNDLLPGDRAFRHDRRSTFLVDEPTLADPRTRQRLADFQISPSGPMWGGTMARASGEPDRIEVEALGSYGLTPADLARADDGLSEMTGGTRRPLRVRLKDPEVEAGGDEHGTFIRCAFELPRGSFATTVMEEIMKVRLTDTEGTETDG